MISLAEERKLIRALGAGDRKLVRFLLATGCRISEALGIAPEHVQRLDDFYVIRIHGKGDKWRQVYYHQVPMDFSDLGTRMAITNRIRRTSRRVIGRTISAHCLRHTFATRKLKEGKSLPAVSRYLGHSSVAITGDLYVHDALEWKDVR